jgi:hypothetical protein
VSHLHLRAAERLAAEDERVRSELWARIRAQGDSPKMTEAHKREREERRRNKAAAKARRYRARKRLA